MLKGVNHPRLTLPRYNVLMALCEAGKLGLNKDELVERSGHNDAINILKRLARNNPDWESVIQLPGVPRMRYRVV